MPDEDSCSSSHAISCADSSDGSTMSGDSSSDYQIDDGEKSDEEDGDSDNSNHDSSDGSTMGGDSSSDYQMSAGESSDDEDCALLSCRNDICAIRDVDEKDKLIYKMESIDVDGQRGQLHRAYRSSGDWVSIEDWAMWIAEKSRRGNQARSATVKAIKSAPFDAVFFETKGTTKEKAGKQHFSFALIESPALCRFGESGTDADTFAAYFEHSDETNGVAFTNLGGDARLIAPVPPKLSDDSLLNPYSHLAKFVRDAPSRQVKQLWVKVGTEFLNSLESASSETIWLSTSGLGVAWLHFRLDSSPKYYEYEPFSEAPRRENPPRARKAPSLFIPGSNAK